MKNRLYAFFLLVALPCALGLTSCSDDENEGNKINHVGEQWNIASVEYNIIDQSLGGQGIKNGTKSNAGSFYFDGTKGSFDIKIDDIHKEDVFSYNESSGEVNITTISQSVGTGSFSQNVIALSGEKDSNTTMTLDGTITKQSMTGQFVMTATFMLVKQ